MYDRFKIRIENTGQIEEIKYLYKHLILTNDELIKIHNIKEFAENLELDFISVEKKGRLKFLHISNIECKNDIEEYGLLSSEGDLGIGIYIVDKNNEEGIENLKTFISESYNKEDMKLLIVEGNYNGKYYECIYGYGHKGYIVVNDKILKDNISNIYEENIDIFLLS